MSDARFAALRATLDNEHTALLTIVIAVCNAVARLLVTLRIGVGDHYMPYLHRFPLPTS